MKIVIVTDAWYPQTNGVVTTLNRTGTCLREMGHEVLYVTPEKFRSIPLPTYSEIRLSLFPYAKVARILDDFAPEAIHIATEGPLGGAVRRYCRRRRLKFTTAYHTRFPQYVRMRAPIPVSISYAILRRFHRQAQRTMVPTESIRKELLARGFSNVVIWSRGVDTETFQPGGKEFLPGPRPVSIFVGRVAIEKNIEAFLGLSLPGTKYVVGDGPDLQLLRQRYPEVSFVGYKFGEELVKHIAAADVFVFPSRTDTFGLVMLEAMACGVPVAAYPVAGPVDVVQQGVTGMLDEDLGKAITGALKLNSEDARRYAEQHSWMMATRQFFSHLEYNPREQQAQAVDETA
ncbi:MAG: glycosyltransferase family 1 protein [Gammaproteobacteria bacterium]